MSSHFEGQPLALLEAMACGLPVLLSDIPELREVGGSNALYFDLGDPNSLVEKIYEIMNGLHDLSRMADVGYSFSAENAKMDKYMQKLKSLYLS